MILRIVAILILAGYIAMGLVMVVNEAYWWVGRKRRG